MTDIDPAGINPGTDPDVLMLRLVAAAEDHATPVILHARPGAANGSAPLDPWRGEVLTVPGIAVMDALPLARLALHGWIVRQQGAVTLTESGRLQPL